MRRETKKKSSERDYSKALLFPKDHGYKTQKIYYVKQPLRSTDNEVPGSRQKTTSKSVNQTKYQNKKRKLAYLIRVEL